MRLLKSKNENSKGTHSAQTVDRTSPRPIITPKDEPLAQVDNVATPGSTVSASNMPAGPAPGPSMPTAESLEGDEDGQPLSPYSANRAAIRNLTMPSVPNFEIPPSPPGSPPMGSTKKFARFLALKKQGVHFNDKLDKSSALRNPSLLKKLRDFASIDENDQYASTLPEGLATPTEFPSWAYPEEIAKRQEQRKKNRDKIDFVPAAASIASAASSSNSTPGQLSVAERVRAGLSRDSSKSPAVPPTAKRKDP